MSEPTSMKCRKCGLETNPPFASDEMWCNCESPPVVTKRGDLPALVLPATPTREQLAALDAAHAERHRRDFVDRAAMHLFAQSGLRTGDAGLAAYADAEILWAARQKWWAAAGKEGANASHQG